MGSNPIGFIWTTSVWIVLLSVGFFYSMPLSDCLCLCLACCLFLCLLCLFLLFPLPVMPLPVCLYCLLFACCLSCLPTACSSACYAYSSASIQSCLLSSACLPVAYWLPIPSACYALPVAYYIFCLTACSWSVIFPPTAFCLLPLPLPNVFRIKKCICAWAAVC